MVFYKGQMVAKQGNNLMPTPKTTGSELSDTMHVKPFNIESLKLKANGENFPVIEIIPGQIITKKRIAKVKAQHGAIVADIGEDVLKLVVVERHKATGNIGLGMVKGFKLERGALASSVAHDSHNIVSVGTNDSDIFTAIKEVEKLHGGLVVCADGRILASLPLPIAGLLSPEPLKVVVNKLDNVEKAAARLGKLPPAPFSLLSFIALPVIPELRLSDLGIVDVLAFKLIK
jgi:adenine deaminase